MRWPLLVLAVIVVCLVLPDRAAARAWERPVAGPVLRSFNLAADRFAAGQHRGVDLAAAVGARVTAACGGRVSFAGRVPRGGLTVSVRCGRLVATYQHLGAAAVSRGQVVVPGASVGTVGSGRARTPHVHLGARDRATGAYVDPLALLGAAPRTPPPLPVARRTPPPLPVARRPLPLGPAPSVHRPVPVGAPSAGAQHLPWPVWLGAVLLGFGVPIGGLARARGRWRRVTAPEPQTAA
jgi:hypothetical protein